MRIIPSGSGSQPGGETPRGIWAERRSVPTPEKLEQRNTSTRCGRGADLYIDQFGDIIRGNGTRS